MAKAREPKVFRSMDDLPLMLTPYDLMDFLGKGYYVKKAHDTIPLDTPIAGCTGIVVEVTLGTPKDDHHFTDLCDDCRLKFLKMAVEHLERKVAAEKEGLNNDGEETDV